MCLVFTFHSFFFFLLIHFILMHFKFMFHFFVFRSLDLVCTSSVFFFFFFVNLTTLEKKLHENEIIRRREKRNKKFEIFLLFDDVYCIVECVMDWLTVANLFSNTSNRWTYKSVSVSACDGCACACVQSQKRSETKQQQNLWSNISTSRILSCMACYIHLLCLCRRQQRRRRRRHSNIVSFVQNQITLSTRCKTKRKAINI